VNALGKFIAQSASDNHQEHLAATWWVTADAENGRNTSHPGPRTLQRYPLGTA
jgi:hypothetical protein